MKITIEELPIELKNEVVGVGGSVTYYHELDECFIATFDHHEVETHSDGITITDNLTGGAIIIDRLDFYKIEIM